MAEDEAGYVLMYRNNKNQQHYLTAKLTWVQRASQAAHFKTSAEVADWWQEVSTNTAGKGDLVGTRRSDRVMIVKVSDLAQGTKAGVPVASNRELLKLLGAATVTEPVDDGRVRQALVDLLRAVDQLPELRAAVKQHDNLLAIDFLHVLELTDLAELDAESFLKDFQEERRERRRLKDRYQLINAVAGAFNQAQLLHGLTEVNVLGERKYHFRTKRVGKKDYRRPVRMTPPRRPWWGRLRRP